MPFGKAGFYLSGGMLEISAAVSDSRCRRSLSVRPLPILNADG
ncbi:hypothetical protein NEICINOT_03438 [Neisseria cinerea ATCC 14685]|uniref:Uncharacterized protein n=1 Tax=Neisseria cinerea ATCC 14685 TaxID=546262 RepID=D0W1B8_NEICI|nr:hypothetical protein NEICINOT_03438 [Neisseria cinerea ATCC 14685]